MDMDNALRDFLRMRHENEKVEAWLDENVEVIKTLTDMDTLDWTPRMLPFVKAVILMQGSALTIQKVERDIRAHNRADDAS